MPVSSYLCKLDAGAFAPCFLLTSYSGLAQGLHTFQVKVVDDAGNASAPAMRAFIVDTIDPTVTLTPPLPPNPSSSQSATFTFTGSDGGGSGIASYRYRLDGGSWSSGGSPETLTGLSFASHTFQVEAIDKAGNISAPAGYTWLIQAVQTGIDFTMAGDVNTTTSGKLYPGGPARAIPVKLTNPNSVPIFVTAVTVGLDATTLPAGCQASWFVFTQSNISAANTVTVPASGGTVTLPNGTVTAPTVQMTNTGNQNACAGATFTLTYTGSAHS